MASVIIFGSYGVVPYGSIMAEGPRSSTCLNRKIGRVSENTIKISTFYKSANSAPLKYIIRH